METARTGPLRGLVSRMSADQFHWMARCLEFAGTAPAPKLQKTCLRMARSFQIDAVLLAMSHSTIAESRRLLASNWSERGNGRQDALLADSRARVADSKRLLASFETTATTPSGEARRETLTMPTAPPAARAEMDRNPAAVSVCR